MTGPNRDLKAIVWLCPAETDISVAGLPNPPNGVIGPLVMEPENTSGKVGPKPILLLFSDDSTLFFALRMRRELHQADPNRPIELVWYLPESALSYRQMVQLLPEGPDRTVGAEGLAALALSPEVEAILTSRVYRELRNVTRPLSYRLTGNRPCIMAFLGGLDFFPRNGFERRQDCDAVYLFPRSNIDAYKKTVAASENGWQEVGFGHPAFLRPQGSSPDLSQRSDIYFFTQALSPSTKRGRLHMLRAMVAIARANPDRQVWIKLRHLPHENQNHLHRERFDYPSLLKMLPSVPPNLRLTSCTMDEALATAALGITCTSTAAIDLVRAGLPTMVHLDFVDNYRDPLVERMRKLFASSNLITPLDQMLELRAAVPEPSWVESMFCSRDLGDQVLQTISRFRSRPCQIRGVEGEKFP